MRSSRTGLEKNHDSWGWFVAVGIVLIAFGVLCIVQDVTATLVSVLTFAWGLLLIRLDRTRSQLQAQ